MREKDLVHIILSEKRCIQKYMLYQNVNQMLNTLRTPQFQGAELSFGSQLL